MGNHTGEGGRNTDNVNTAVNDTSSVQNHALHNPTLFC